jgi:apolipoprotein N-acyltransferase
VTGLHDKVKLLPFAEYAPWPFAPGSLGEAAPGRAPRVLSWRGASFGPLVCYEVLFARLARRLAADGAGVLVNLSNDSWFGATGAAEQHLAAAMYRAIETGRPLLRATHTGITVALDARGRVVARLPRDVPGTRAIDVEPGRGITPYTRFGDAPLGAALLAGLALTSFRRRRPPSRLR